jgi:predicted AAA+ superfamily ATPase
MRQDRKPLVLRGARQVGKSYLVRTWGEGRFRNLVEVNLERDTKVVSCFADNDPSATLRRLEAHTGKPIARNGDTLLFLDEIQAVPEVLAKLRWLAEELPTLPVVAAGSLLDFALAEHSFSMPVGRVSYLHLEPMGFGEFLCALDEERLAAFLAEEVTVARIGAGDAIPPALHDKLLGLLREYLLVGGMPAAVERYRRERSLLSVAEVHHDLLATLRDDFSKYASRVHHRRLVAVLDSVAQQLGSKFRYRRVDREERAEALRKAVDLLCLARVCHRVQATAASAAPLAAGAAGRPWKVVLLDVGLVSASLGLSLGDLDREPELTLCNRGALAEQLVGQLLRLNFPAHQEPALYYWQRDERGAEAEVDYVVQQGAQLVPVEVKAGATGALKSLHILMAERGWPTAIRFCASPPSLVKVAAQTRSGKTARFTLLSLPLYLVEQLPRLCGEIEGQ